MRLSGDGAHVDTSWHAGIDRIAHGHMDRPIPSHDGGSLMRYGTSDNNGSQHGDVKQQCRLNSSVTRDGASSVAGEIAWHRWNARAAPCSLWIVPVALSRVPVCWQNATWLYQGAWSTHSSGFDEIGPSSRVQQCCFIAGEQATTMIALCGGCLLPIARFWYRPSATLLPYNTIYIALQQLNLRARGAPRCWFSSKGGGRQIVCRFPILSVILSTNWRLLLGFMVVPTCQACVDLPESG